MKRELKKWLLRTGLLLTLGLLLLIGLTTPLLAGEIRVHNGKTITVTGQTLFANCADTIIEEGSLLILSSAVLQDMGRRSGAGLLSNTNNSTIQKCFKSYYVIPKKDGSAIIFGL